MASEKQIAANRAIARLSTGPRTKSGKACSRQNAWKHGLTARAVVIDGEDTDDFDMLRAELEEEFGPLTGMQRALVDRATGLIWRLRRIASFEAALIDQSRRGSVPQKIIVNFHYVDGFEDPDKGESIEAQMERRKSVEAQKDRESSIEAEKHGRESELPTTPEEKSRPEQGIGLVLPDFDRLCRYEASLMNALSKTLHMILLLKARSVA